MAANKVTERAEIFVREYRAHRNATKAAIAAGYSAKTAEAAGSRLLRNVKVSAAIAEQDSALHRQLDLTAERVLQEIARVCFVDIRKLFRPDGSAIPITELDEDTAAALAGIEIEEVFGAGADGPKTGYTKKFKLSNKVDALGLAGRYFGLFKDKNQPLEDAGHVSQLSDAALEQILAAVSRNADRKPKAKSGKNPRRGRRT